MADDFWATFWSTGFPTWLSGVGTLGLAAFALFTMRSDQSERERLRKEAESERARGDALMTAAAERAEREQRLEQASQVAVWIDSVDLHGEDLVSKAVFTMQGTTRAAVVRNNSLLPIYDIEVDFFANQTPVREDNFELHRISLVPPNGQKALEVPTKLMSQKDVSAGVTFRDANGTRWKRNRHGALAEAD